MSRTDQTTDSDSEDDGASSSPSENRLRLRRRLDLEIFPQRRRGHNVWVIKDPLSLRYFQFREEEYAILQWLDGRTSLQRIKQRFEQRFAPQRMTQQRLHWFVANLHRNGLVLSDAPGQGTPLRARFERQRWSAWTSAFANPLAIRFRGFDPERFLCWLYPKLRWVFTWWCSAVCLMLVATALMLLATEFESLRQRLPEMNALLSPGNLIVLAVAMAATKLLHELAHALTCKHYGARCHELGVMLLVLTPCLYCNVTDAWKLPSRYRRMAISAAGIIVEIVLAAICTILWFSSQPGLFNTMCLNVMIVCSVGTVLLNGNPLLRYDGYYLLSDFLDMPNLWQDSRQAARRLVSRVFTGIDPGGSVSMQSRRGVNLVYAFASMTYRAVVMVSILFLVYRICKPIGLAFIAQVLAVVLIAALLSTPLTAGWRIMTNPAVRRRVKTGRLIASSVVTTLIVAACFLIPLPCRIAAPMMIEPRQARRVYVSVPGRLTQAVAVGTKVTAGQPLATLENIDVRRELERVQGQLRQQQLRVKNLESLRGNDEALASQLPAAREILADLQRRLQQLRKDEQALVLTAPVDGTVLAPPTLANQAAAQTSSELELPRWSGTPMDPSNRGSTLERKTLYCLVGQENAFEAAVYIDQSDLQFVRENQRVKMRLDIAGGEVVNGTVTEISRVNLESVPSELAVDQQISNRIDSSGVLRPQTTSYKAHVTLDSTDVPLLIGARGRAKIIVQGQPLSQRVYRVLSRTFKSVI
ncbi:HlyD family secretion protein [Stieleria maiorica]|uniref:HlyD family secretion protein n=1 Tax=Stieleria maiorica TaxID=2795974 RepID=A0A5B9MMY8_9BACT|nr:site-2 protease family protein [Stieleria maiorica]QEG01411.1 HlyD family secretion protein [Stieleria maiorica]